MKKLISFILITLFAFSISPFFSLPAKAADYGYEIENYDVNINVLENNIYDITETIDVNFKENRHGIFRTLPVISKATRQYEGKDIVKTHKIIISDISVSGTSSGYTQYEQSRDGDYLVLKIGNPDEYVYGVKRYVIKYKYDIGEDTITQFDDVYYNLIGNIWDTNINNVSFNITMPKEFDKNLVSFTRGSYGSTSAENITYSINGNTISGKAKEFSPAEGLTVRIEMPEGYFTGEREYSNRYYYGLMAIILVLTLLSAFLWFKYGKDDKFFPTVEFYPPEDLTSADVGYVIDGIVNTEDVISLIIYWADKGYLSIREEKKEMILTKLKDADNKMKPYEKRMFNQMFKEKDEVSPSDLQYKFSNALYEAKNGVKAGFDTYKEKKLYTSSSVAIQIFNCLFAGLSMGIILGAAVYDFAFDLAAGFIIGAIAGAIIIAASAFACVAVDVTYKNKSSVMFIISMILLTILSCIGVLIAIAISTMWILAIFGGVCTVLCGFFAAVGKKRTKYGYDMLGKLVGLRQFIELAEKDKLEMLVNENPSYFYSILPFAYVLGVTDKWAKRFESIALEAPRWYSSPSPFNTFMFIHFMNHNLNSYQTSMQSVQPAKSSGSGGFGGMGGGGFSGGGFGGGGGGSW